MKKLFVCLMAIVCVLSTTVLAAGDITFRDSEPDDLGEFVLEVGPGEEEMTEHTGDFANLTAGGGSFCNKMEGVARYEFTVEKDGIYSFVVEYVARDDKDRSIDVALDSVTNNQWVDLAESNDHRWAVIPYELTAGKHDFYIMAPTGFDDSVVKSCDIYGWDLYLTEELVEETVIETEAETAAAEETVVTAPQTWDAGIVAAVAAIVSAAGYTIGKKAR